MISNYLLAFNSEHEHYASSDSLFNYLDENIPDWRDLITSQDELIEFFRTDVHVYQNSWLKKLANEIFNNIKDSNLIESVWKDVTLNEWYRYAAIKRLISLDSNAYLPEYIAELVSGGFVLGGWGFTMISELYDFPNSVKIILESNKYEGNNLEFLAEKAIDYWGEYPQDLRVKILKERDYFMRKNGNQTMWNMMTIEEKLYLTNVIVANEYAKFHDVVTFAFFLNDLDESKVVLLTNEFSHQLKNVVVNEQPRREMRDVSFDCPEYDEETCQYNPSEQISRYLSIAQTDSNNMAYSLLKRTITQLSLSEHRRYCY